MLLTTLFNSSGCSRVTTSLVLHPSLPSLCLVLGQAALLLRLSVKLAARSQESPALFLLHVIVRAAWTLLCFRMNFRIFFKLPNRDSDGERTESTGHFWYCRRLAGC